MSILTVVMNVDRLMDADAVRKNSELLDTILKHTCTVCVFLMAVTEEAARSVLANFVCSVAAPDTNYNKIMQRVADQYSTQFPIISQTEKKIKELGEKP